MKFNKEEFLRTELGQMMKECTRNRVNALKDVGKCSLDTPEYDEALKTAAICAEKWEVYRAAVKQFYGVECYFTKRGDYSGITLEDKTNWLLKINRHTGEEITEPSIEVAIDTAQLQEGFAELALPVIEHKPQMPEEKEKLVNLLMGFVKDAVNPMAYETHMQSLPAVANVLAGLVN